MNIRDFNRRLTVRDALERLAEQIRVERDSRYEAAHKLELLVLGLILEELCRLDTHMPLWEELNVCCGRPHQAWCAP